MSKTPPAPKPVTAFRDFIGGRDFPCVGAKSALGKEQLTHLVLEDMASEGEDRRLLRAFYGFVDNYRQNPALFTSFAVSWRGPRGLSERAFEALLWERLRALHRLDRGEHDWDERVDPDPDSPHFSFSLREEAFFVVGLHDGASRMARRFSYPTLIFNLHDQFERLREEGRYQKLHDTIMARDEALQGEPNPMIARHGEAPAARQYSGRKVDEDWECPFSPASEQG
ncbi:guanitoxin biosynthesis heme-dependent pre-guanitoxin N-hydroxylase GntA [Parvularcula oceani]|uniref:guanitoxin biosynthesis heme-dependent pre-guanitoxin N-hydroxylase GntA n=1 Tax=Parvularcula oceani TaxID=1247963 RepID=UPI0004E166FC|nr:guanitoxin biosynthesis heme-dependent pre-guanitoxin N-hydroxylase GntA [Parvularcula oceani]